MVLNFNQDENSCVYQTGQEVMSGNGVVLFGMSPGNPYFKSRVIEDYVQYLGKENRRIIVVVPQQPAEHTYRALCSKDAVKRAKQNASQLKSHCRRTIEKNPPMKMTPGTVQEGVYYLLKELAFIIARKEIFRTDKVAVIYHRSWPVCEKFVYGTMTERLRRDWD